MNPTNRQQADTSYEKINVLLCLDVLSNDVTHCMSQGQIPRSEIESGTASKKYLETSNDNIISMPLSINSKGSECAAEHDGVTRQTFITMTARLILDSQKNIQIRHSKTYKLNMVFQF